LSDESRLTIVVTASPIPSHPSTAGIDEVIESLKFLGIRDHVRVILAHDAPRSRKNPRGAVAYRKYLEKLRLKYSEPRFSLLTRTRWGHLSQTLVNAVDHISTPFVLVLQHDLPFVRHVNLSALLDVMESNPEIKHVRFNKRENFAAAWDANDDRFRINPISRSQFFSEVRARSSHGEVSLVQTLAWTDQNFLCRTAYVRDIVSPLVARLRCFPERVLNPLNTESTHLFFGTYVWGPLGAPPAIKHSDGAERTKSPRSERNATSMRREVPKPKILAYLPKVARRLKIRVKHVRKAIEFLFLRNVGQLRLKRLLRTRG
jgi:hypothetical protein